MTDAPPTVSIVIPCFNLGRYLDEAVSSVFDQTFQDFEILIVDDGSTDPVTCELLADYRRDRTRVLRSANAGLPAAKNLGIANTRGAWLCMLDADDRLRAQFLERSMQAAAEDPSAAFISHWLQTFGDETWAWTPTACDLASLLDVNTVNGAALVRRTALEAVGGFDESMRDGCEDWDLWISLVERGFTGRIVQEVLFDYRRRADSMSRTMMESGGHARLYRRLVEKHASSFRLHLGILAARREGDLARLRLHSHDLDLEYVQSLAPTLAKAEEDAARLERKHAAESARASLEAHVRGLEDEVHRLRADLEAADHRERELAHDVDRAHTEAAHVSRALEIARARALELDAAANRSAGEVAALRQSVSWRIAAPLRAAYDALRRLRGDRPS